MKTLGIFLGTIFLIGLFVVGGINGVIIADENVNASWSQVQNQYQRRSDLIPNLVNTVKGYAAHENETLKEVVQARANATKTNINIEDAKQMQQYMQAQQGISSALSRLMMVVEKYPDLKANQNFLALQDQLEGTENRISVARKDYIDTVNKFNKKVRTFPGVLWASLVGIEKKATFEAEEKAQVAPAVNF